VKKVMVTGAGGYIGSVLTGKLASAGYEVLAIDRFFFGRQTLPPDANGFRTVRDDIRWMDESLFEGIYAVIDLAALSNDPAGDLDPDKTWDVNHRGRARVARLAKQHGVQRYILPSSCSIYGFQEGIMDETSEVNPLTTYAKANLAAERDALALSDDSFCVIILRQATVYGLSPRMRFDLAINGMVKGLIQSGRVPILREGTQWRPFVHVRDTSEAMRLVLEADPSIVNGERFNIGSDDQNIQIMPLAQAVAEALDLPFEWDWYGLPDHRSYRVSFAKAKETLGFAPEHSPADGAREVSRAIADGSLDPNDPRTITVEWYKHLLESHRLVREVELEGTLL
jgi:nucleoside-diphosphate-sugar epimerase